LNLKIAALFPDHLNLNGDQANLFVLQKRLEWRGTPSTLVAVEKNQDLPTDVDLIFLGHGSIAAWADISPDLERLAPQILKALRSGVAFMAVASGYERAIEFGFFEGSLEPSERVSKFVIATIGELDVLGYLNASTKAPILQKNGLSIGTQLHGPVFSKNPVLADNYLDEIFAAKGYAFPKSPAVKNGQTFELIDSIVESVWSLEKELASE
jgi:CobQ-like glutamine amidotransferase family enzyme